MATGNHWITCRHCGEKHNTSGNYVSPANRERDRQWWLDEHESGKCAAGVLSSQKSYNPGELRMVRSMGLPVMDNVAYFVEVISTGSMINTEPLTEQRAMLLMRELGCPYIGVKYDDHIWRTRDERVATLPVPSLTDEQLFNQAKDQLIAATGSPGLTSFHDNSVHMTLGEFQRLVTVIADAQATTASIRQACDAAEYKVPGRHDTWDSFHEGQASMADQINDLLPPAQPHEPGAPTNA